MIVVDTNIISYLFLNGEKTSLAEDLLKKDQKWLAPLLWRSEFTNVLLNYVRKRYLKETDAHQLLLSAQRLLKGNEYEINQEKTLTAAVQSGCSAYDCEYITLAQDLKTPLITEDKALLKAFPDIAYTMEKYLHL